MDNQQETKGNKLQSRFLRDYAWKPYKGYDIVQSSRKLLEFLTIIEIIWTITPSLILILIALPSFKLLYLTDELYNPAMTVVAEGRQWYWSYQYPDFLNSKDELIEFDSYIVPESDLEPGGLRMLEVDNRVILPELTHIRFVITSGDVIHKKWGTHYCVK